MDNLQAVIDAARAGHEVKTLAHGDCFQVIYSPTHGVQTIELEKHALFPVRKRGGVVVFDADSLNRLLVDHGTAENTTVYINRDPIKPAIVAVFNGNGQGGPGFGDFRASIGFRETPQWVKWKGIDGKLMAQADFAEFVEDNLEDIASPDGATMMEIVTQLQAKREVDFRSGLKLSNGCVQLTHNESIQASVGAGNFAVPEQFKIKLAPIFGVQPFEVPARFRYRIEDRKLKLGFRLQRLEDVMAQVMKDIEAEIDLPEGVAKVYGIAP